MFDYPGDISTDGHQTWRANRSAHVVCCCSHSEKKRDGDGRCLADRCILVFSCEDTTSHFNS